MNALCTCTESKKVQNTNFSFYCPDFLGVPKRQMDRWAEAEENHRGGRGGGKSTYELYKDCGMRSRFVMS